MESFTSTFLPLTWSCIDASLSDSAALRLDPAQRAREGHDLDAPGTRRPECGRRGGRRGSGRVDVVDEGYPARRRRRRPERAADAAAFVARRAALPAAAHALEKRRARKLPVARKLARETFRRVVAPRETARAVGGDECEGV